mmetsp:Transcript_85588/g.266133  ORF Transcript_85588/g.266133 Transcript_85588/m.266133 type:complete len:707 (+) Transcript_85588:157-2277(+)
MKFAKQLEEYELPEWRGHYIPYKTLKKRLERLAHSDAEEDSPERWRGTLREEALRVGSFVDRGLQGLEWQLQDLARTADGLRRASSSGKLSGHAEGDEEGDDEEEGPLSEHAYLELRVLDALGRVAEGVHRLRSFAELNHAALYKILKKHDKQLKTDLGLGVSRGDDEEKASGGLFKDLVRLSRLGESGRFDSLEAELKRLSLQSSKIEGLDASPAVARLAAGLGRSAPGNVQGGATPEVRSYELVLCFFLGSSVALFLAIGVLLALPAVSPKSFSEAYFLTPMPVFRVVFSVLLSLWCMGAVAWTCDKHDINHMFILGVDPRCRVNPTFFFSRAAALTTVWILIFGMYVVDYKWRVLPTVWAKSGINKRASFHFVLYPIALLAATVLGMLWPSRICRNRYKGEVLRSVRRTAMAPFQPVDFADNIVGDILTSLAKPLQDVPAAVCYLLSPHPEPQSFVEKFALKGDTCSDDTHHCVLPVIAGLPYVFRALQCLRRFRDTRETRHLWNFGKYLSSLLVVVVSSVWWENLEAIAVVSAVATVYAGAWDVALDWGLGRQELLGCCGRAAAKPRDPQSVDREPTLPNTPTSKPARAERPERHLAGRVYWLCSFIDLAARSTWVLTLMPITIVTGSITGRVVLVSIISSVEIIRRSMWAVIRIEYEQLANASGFRALLWVPSKLNAAADRRTTMAGLGGPANLAQPLLQH